MDERTEPLKKRSPGGGLQMFATARHVQQKYRKQFKFFLCHQKAGAGSMARLLKMELEPPGDNEGPKHQPW